MTKRKYKPFHAKVIIWTSGTNINWHYTSSDAFLQYGVLTHSLTSATTEFSLSHQNCLVTGSGKFNSQEELCSCNKAMLKFLVKQMGKGIVEVSVTRFLIELSTFIHLPQNMYVLESRGLRANNSLNLHGTWIKGRVRGFSPRMEFSLHILQYFKKYQKPGREMCFFWSLSFIIWKIVILPTSQFCFKILERWIQNLTNSMWSIY